MHRREEIKMAVAIQFPVSVDILKCNQTSQKSKSQWPLFTFFCNKKRRNFVPRIEEDDRGKKRVSYQLYHQIGRELSKEDFDSWSCALCCSNSLVTWLTFFFVYVENKLLHFCLWQQQLLLAKNRSLFVCYKLINFLFSFSLMSTVCVCSSKCQDVTRHTRGGTNKLIMYVCVHSRTSFFSLIDKTVDCKLFCLRHTKHKEEEEGQNDLSSFLPDRWAEKDGGPDGQWLLRCCCSLVLWVGCNDSAGRHTIVWHQD